jgi:hypothetical protein
VGKTRVNPLTDQLANPLILVTKAEKHWFFNQLNRRNIMIIKARFTQDISTLNKWLTAYQATNGAVQFFTSAVFTNNSEIIGKDHEVMFFIGYVAGIGESGLESVSKV